jgi:hypothetical protein
MSGSKDVREVRSVHVLFFAAFHFAHLAFCAAAMRFRAAADGERRRFIGTTFCPLTLAHRAR